MSRERRLFCKRGEIGANSALAGRAQRFPRCHVTGDGHGQERHRALAQLELANRGGERGACPRRIQIRREICPAKIVLTVHRHTHVARGNFLGRTDADRFASGERDLERPSHELARHFRLRDVGLDPPERDLTPANARGRRGGLGRGDFLRRNIEGERLERIDGGKHHPALSIDLELECRELECVALQSPLGLERERERPDFGGQIRFHQRSNLALKLRRKRSGWLRPGQQIGGYGAGERITVARRDRDFFQLGHDARRRVIDARTQRHRNPINQDFLALADRHRTQRERLDRAQLYAATIKLGTDHEHAGQFSTGDRARFQDGLGPGERYADQCDAQEFGPGSLGGEALVFERKRELLLRGDSDERSSVGGGHCKLEFTELRGIFAAATVERGSDL